MTDAQRVTIADLVRDHQERTGDSYADIARRSGLSKAKVGQLASPDAKWQPRTDTLRRLATGLQLPLNLVQRAALATAGADLPGDLEDDVTVERLRSLNDEHRAIAGDLIALLWQRERERTDGR